MKLLKDVDCWKWIYLAFAVPKKPWVWCCTHFVARKRQDYLLSEMESFFQKSEHIGYSIRRGIWCLRSSLPIGLWSRRYLGAQQRFWYWCKRGEVYSFKELVLCTRWSALQSSSAHDLQLLHPGKWSLRCMGIVGLLRFLLFLDLEFRIGDDEKALFICSPARED